MCQFLYASANHELPLTDPAAWQGINFSDQDWELRSPRLTVTCLVPKCEGVKRLFDAGFVVNIGSYGKCGCGFNEISDGSPAPDNPNYCNAAQESRKALSLYVAKYQVESLYLCSVGDESLPAEGESNISLSQIADASFPLPERVRMRVYA